jgi:hypothetical protein
VLLERAQGMLVSLHDHFRIRVMDWLLSAILLSVGITILFLDPAVWALPVYDGLSRIAPQHVWAAVAIGLALARLLALFVNGAVRRSPELRCAGAFLAIFIWVQLSLGLMLTIETTGLAVAVFPWLAFADMFNVYRAAGDIQVLNPKAFARRRSRAPDAAGT